jgi:hypothetical protein
VAEGSGDVSVVGADAAGRPQDLRTDAKKTVADSYCFVKVSTTCAAAYWSRSCDQLVALRLNLRIESGQHTLYVSEVAIRRPLEGPDGLDERGRVDCEEAIEKSIDF